MRFLHCILSFSLLNSTYALYGLPCFSDLDCKSENELCKAGRCGCNSHTRSEYNTDLRQECDEFHADKCKSENDCGGPLGRSFWHQICNKNGICECEPGYIFVGYICYKIDKPGGKSFLKNCKHDIRIYSSEKNDEVPFCHPEDNVFCSSHYRFSWGNDFLKGQCICYPGFYGDNETKSCRPKEEFLRANNLKEYKVKPGMYCYTDGDCIEGLDCKENFCQCPDGCVYVERLESCDCGNYFDSDEYWDLSYVWPSIVGTILGLVISCGWCVCIAETVERLFKDDEDGENNREEEALNPLPSEVNEPVSVPVVQDILLPTQPPGYFPPYPNCASSMADGITYSVPGPPLNFPTSGEKVNPSSFNASPYHTVPQPYVPQTYNLQPYGPHPSDHQPSAPMYAPGPLYDGPPPSYSETLAQDAHQGQLSNEEEPTDSVTVKHPSWR